MPPTIVAMTSMARISSGVAPPVTSPLRIVTSPRVPGARWPRRDLVAQGVRRIQGHGTQPLLGGQQLLEDPVGGLGILPTAAIHAAGDLVHGPPDVIGQGEVREEPWRIGGGGDVQAGVDEVPQSGEPADLLGRIVGAVTHVVIPQHPVDRARRRGG